MQIRSILLGACRLGLGLLTAASIAHSDPLSAPDKQFMAMAAKADMTEAHEGQMAENQAKSADVKSLASTLVQDHTDNYASLSALASKAGDSIPQGIDAAKDPAIQRLAHLKGKSFDREFVRDEVAAHRQAIAAFKREAQHGQDADVKAYASKTIPVLEKHLKLAENCLRPAKHT